jgi:radical SAM protein with 4Fe4S-binding SPASM domain
MNYKDVITIKTGYICNNHCKFCCFFKSRDFKINKTFSKIKREIFDNKTSFSKLLFLGGEVTIRSDFINLISFAKECKYAEVHIQTNGRVFSNFNFAKKTIENGAKHFIVSFHANTAKAQDYISESKGSFFQTIEGIKNLKRFNAYVKTNTVISRYNYKILPHMANKIILLKVNEARFSLISLIGGALDKREMFAIRITKVMPYLIKSLIKLTVRGIPFETEGIPKCIIASRISQTNIKNKTKNKILTNYKENIFADGKIKESKCRKCSHYDNCGGPWKDYIENFGWNEFKPIKKIQAS